jgi:hypothetical protein
MTVFLGDPTYSTTGGTVNWNTNTGGSTSGTINIPNSTIGIGPLYTEGTGTITFSQDLKDEIESLKKKIGKLSLDNSFLRGEIHALKERFDKVENDPLAFLKQRVQEFSLK